MSDSHHLLDDAHLLKCEMAGEVLRAHGRLHFQATGWSMLPAVLPGDTLVVDRINPKDVCEGDIVLFQRDRRLFAHRVTSRESDLQIMTRGDSMPQADGPVKHEEVLGRVSSLTRNRRTIVPRKNPSVSARIVAGLISRSTIAARVFVGIHGILKVANA